MVFKTLNLYILAHESWNQMSLKQLKMSQIVHFLFKQLNIFMFLKKFLMLQIILSMYFLLFWMKNIITLTRGKSYSAELV